VMPAPVKTRAIIDIEEVYARGFDLDQDLVRVGPRIGQSFVAEDFRSAEFMDANGLHGSYLRSVIEDRDDARRRRFGFPLDRQGDDLGRSADLIEIDQIFDLENDSRQNRPMHPHGAG